MSKDDFSYDDEAVEKEKKKRKKGGLDLIKIDSGKCYILILPPGKEHKHKAPFIENTVHKLKIKGQFYEATAASNEDESDPIADLSWKVYETFKNSKNEARKNAWKDFKPKNESFANVVKLKKHKSKKTKKVTWSYVESGPMRLPVAVLNTLITELDESSVKEVCHPDLGKIMLIADNGKTGLARQYESCKFLSKPANLLKNKIVADMDEVKENMIDLSTIAKAYSESDISKLYKALKKKHAKLLALMKEDDDSTEDSVDEEEVEEEVSEDDMELDDEAGDDDDTEIDDDDSDSDDDDDDVEIDDDDSDDDDDDYEV